MEQKVNLLKVFGKKPRASKTSKRYSVLGEPFFLQQSQAETSNMVMVWHDLPPYPYIHTVDTESHEEAILWIETNLQKIKSKLLRIDDFVRLPKEAFKVKVEKEFEVYDKPIRPYMEQIVIPKNKTYTREDVPEFYYLYVDKDKLPMKSSKVIDKEKVLNVYLERINEESN